jgi:DnaJ domain
MAMQSRNALGVALDLFRRPIGVRDQQKQILPNDVITVIRIAAGDAVETSRFGGDHDKRVLEIQEACIFYVQQILFHPGADDYRILGLSPGATSKQIQEHKRMLLKWLHPDRNHNTWEQKHFNRVIAAAENLEAGAGGISPAGTPETVTAQPKMRRKGRRLDAFAQQRERRPMHWKERFVKYLKRFAFVIGGIVVGAAIWQLGIGISPE